MRFSIMVEHPFFSLQLDGFWVPFEALKVGFVPEMKQSVLGERLQKCVAEGSEGSEAYHLSRVVTPVC